MHAHICHYTYCTHILGVKNSAAARGLVDERLTATPQPWPQFGTVPADISFYLALLC